VTTPRLRPELHATPIEEQGLKFFDVSDPRSGGKMRLYDFEWLLASQMDGRRSLDEIARWAHGTLQLEVTSPNLAAYAERLAELGFIAAPEPPVAGRTSDPASYSATTTPLPPPQPSTDLDGEDVPMEMSAEDDTVTQRQEALPPRQMNEMPAPLRPPSTAPSSSLGFEATKQRPDEKTDRGQNARPEVTVTSSRSAEVTAPPKSGSTRSIVGLLIVLLIIGAVVAYVMLFANGEGVVGGNKVGTATVKTREVVALYDGSAKLEKSATRPLAFGETGKVTDVVAVGTEVKAGMPLATLDGYAKVEKEIADVKDRLGFYQKQLDNAGSKGEEAVKAAEAKVAEKKKLLGELEAKAAKLRLVAPGPGTVEKVHVSAGAEAKANAPAVELAGSGVAATFKIADTGTLKAGDDVSLQAASGGTSPAKISKLGDGEVTVELGEGATAKPGDDVRLVKSKMPAVVVVPASAVVKKNGADVVFVLSGGIAHAKKVTIADRSGGEVFLSSGVNAGEQIITTGGEALNDGDKASANP
jgi:multidrug efflux pump subunit AcrA (membrane-fusion protein)